MRVLLSAVVALVVVSEAGAQCPGGVCYPPNGNGYGYAPQGTGFSYQNGFQYNSNGPGPGIAVYSVPRFRRHRFDGRGYSLPPWVSEQRSYESFGAYNGYPVYPGGYGGCTGGPWWGR
jgi:hypothetical protein